MMKPMNGRERIEALLSGRPTDRPPFAPAVYEHKAALIGTTPSNLARDPRLLERAIAREIELYDADMITVGVDVYNVEAEALGCSVKYYSSNDVPSVESRVLEPGGGLGRLRLPDPRRAGRMPVFLEAGLLAQARFGGQRLVRGAVSAPFSIACELVGSEKMYLALLDDPAWVSELLAFTASVVKIYGRAFSEIGLGVVLFDSHASPPLVSPALYRKVIFPPTAGVISYFRRDLGLPLVPYIIGGDTTILLDEILATGTNNILCDFRADLDVFIDRLSGRDILLRRNLDPRFLLEASAPEIRAAVRGLLAAGRRHPGFILGTGILPYDLPPGKVTAVRDALVEFSA
jgi:uroporphyrinogen decarboxylase